MKKNIIIALVFVIASSCNHCKAQGDPKAILEKMTTLTDQYNSHFDNNKLKDKLTIIFVDGVADPITMVYDKLIGKSWKDNINVQIIGSFREMLAQSHGGPGTAGGAEHMQKGFVAKYGKDFFPVLIDLQGTIAESLNIKGLGIVAISKISNKVLSISDFGSDRKKFFDALNPLLK